MFGFGKSSVVAEHEASGEIERVYHQIRLSMRVTGVNLVFRKWAAQDGLLPVIWDAVRPNIETRAFELAADQLRTSAARSALSLARLEAAKRVALGESQAYQVQAALDLYHYINPKLLLMVALVRLALREELPAPSSSLAAGAAEPERIEPGFPDRMYPMEMMPAEPEDDRLREIFTDIQQTLDLQSVNSDYRTLALWPDYLDAVWSSLKPITRRGEYEAATTALRELARTLCSGMPRPVPLGREVVERAGADFEQALASTESFERLLPGLILNVALTLQDWRSEDELARSPFPAAIRSVPPQSSSVK